MTKFAIMIEECPVEKNFSGYIPAIRLGVIGETVEEVMENAKELLVCELQKRQSEGKTLPEETMQLHTIEVDLKRGDVQ